MMTLKIYDPAMCCSSGVCGANVDKKLVQLSAFLKNLDKSCYTVERYNLSQQPDAYVSNPVVAKWMQEKGPEALPIIFVDDKLVCSGRYPTTTELSEWLEIKDHAAISGSCCTSKGRKSCC